MSDFSEPELNYLLDRPRIRFVKQSVELPEDIHAIDQYIQAELWKAYSERLAIEEAFIAHEMIFGVPCGPTLSMVDPTKLAYGGWIGHGS